MATFDCETDTTWKVWEVCLPINSMGTSRSADDVVSCQQKSCLNTTRLKWKCFLVYFSFFSALKSCLFWFLMWFTLQFLSRHHSEASASFSTLIWFSATITFHFSENSLERNPRAINKQIISVNVWSASGLCGYICPSPITCELWHILRRIGEASADLSNKWLASRCCITTHDRINQ